MLSLLANNGTDILPVWVEIGPDDTIFSTGIGSTETLSKPIVRPESGYVWAEEMWTGPATYMGAQKIGNYRKPSRSDQTGLVFKAVFSRDLDAAPFITFYDDESCSTWEKLILTGTTVSKFRSLIKGYITGKEANHIVPPVNWAYCDSGRIGSANPNALCGNEAFVTAPFIPKAGEDMVFTLSLSIPSDAEYGRDGKFDPVFTITAVHV